MKQNVLAFGDSPIIPLRRSLREQLTPLKANPFQRSNETINQDEGETRLKEGEGDAPLLCWSDLFGGKIAHAKGRSSKVGQRTAETKDERIGVSKLSST